MELHPDPNTFGQPAPVVAPASVDPTTVPVPETVLQTVETQVAEVEAEIKAVEPVSVDQLQVELEAAERANLAHHRANPPISFLTTNSVYRDVPTTNGSKRQEQILDVR